MKTDKEKKLQGTFRADRVRGQTEKLEFSSKPIVPEHFTAAGKRFWKILFPLCEKLKTVDPANIPIFENLCCQLALAEECQKRLKTKGYFYKTTTMYERERPEVKTLDKTIKNIMALGLLFGLTLKSRNLLKMEPAPAKPKSDEDDINDFLNRQGKWKRKAAGEIRGDD